MEEFILNCSGDILVLVFGNKNNPNGFMLIDLDEFEQGLWNQLSEEEREVFFLDLVFPDYFEKE